MDVHFFSDKGSTSTVIFVLLVKMSFSDVLKGVTSKDFARYARVVKASYPLHQ